MATVTGWHCHDGNDFNGSPMPTVGQTVTHTYTGGFVYSTHWKKEGLYAALTVERTFFDRDAIARGTVLDKVSWDDATDQVHVEDNKVALTSRTIDQRVDLNSLMLNTITTKALDLITTNLAGRPQSVVDYLNSPAQAAADATQATIEALLDWETMTPEEYQAATVSRLACANNGTRLLSERMIHAIVEVFPDMRATFISDVEAQFT